MVPPPPLAHLFLLSGWPGSRDVGTVITLWQARNHPRLKVTGLNTQLETPQHSASMKLAQAHCYFNTAGVVQRGCCPHVNSIRLPTAVLYFTVKSRLLLLPTRRVAQLWSAPSHILYEREAVFQTLPGCGFTFARRKQSQHIVQHYVKPGCFCESAKTPNVCHFETIKSDWQQSDNV